MTCPQPQAPCVAKAGFIPDAVYLYRPCTWSVSLLCLWGTFILQTRVNSVSWLAASLRGSDERNIPPHLAQGPGCFYLEEAPYLEIQGSSIHSNPFPPPTAVPTLSGKAIHPNYPESIHKDKYKELYLRFKNKRFSKISRSKFPQKEELITDSSKIQMKGPGLPGMFPSLALEGPLLMGSSHLLRSHHPRHVIPLGFALRRVCLLLFFFLTCMLLRIECSLSFRA